MWIEADEAAQRVCSIAADISGCEAGEKELTAAQLLVAELMEYCRVEQVPEGALWAAAEELVRRCSGVSGAVDVSRVTLGDYAVQYRDTDGNEDGGWKWKLRPWRRIGF